MNPDPVKRTPRPSYPTKIEVMMDATLLDRYVPAAWLRSKHVACALAGLIAAGSVGCTACVAVTPPAYLSEEEALAVIRDSLNGYGIEMAPGKTEIPAVTVDLAETDAAGGAGERTIGPVRADLENPERKVVVEFVSAGDYREWTEKEPDARRGKKELRQVAEGMTNAIRGERAGEFYFGAMYEPAMWLPSRETEEERREATKRYLRLQVEEFAEWLKAQGVI